MRVKMRRVRSSSRAWIWTAWGARSRFLARTTLAMRDEVEPERRGDEMEEPRVREK